MGRDRLPPLRLCGTMRSMEPFDPAELATLADPFPQYAELRAQGPVVELAHGFVGVFSHDAATSVLRDPRGGSGMLALRYEATLPPGALRDEMTHRINFLDPPDHPRVRSLVSRAFTPRRIDALRPWIDDTARDLVDALRPDAQGVVELFGGFVHDLPSLVVSELLGVPTADRDRLTGWSDTVTPVFGTSIARAHLERALGAAEEMRGYMEWLATQRRSDPGDDLLSALLEVSDGDERLSHLELMSLVTTLYSAGHRTTRDLFGNGVDLVLRLGHRLSDASVADVVGEMLRLATPTHYVARVPTATMDVGGVEVGAGTPIVVFLAAANRDPAVYDAPDSFAPGRSGPPPLSFAFGAHYCLGAALARSEAEAMLRALIERWPDLRIADPDAPARWHQRGPFRGLDELMVLVD
jgi:cytochrome P450